ncbi:hypothetical protein F5Y18DRAFT_9603 [Xylariaceae sp. FL1019]|nr:hypothetical protein F5Y18DRAFT_9603 [Xylariaceae sp. FL1019]
MTTESSSLRTQLLNIRDFSDLTLVCHGQKFKVHKAILCAQSPVFTAAVKGKFMEASTSMINVAFDIETLKRMLEYLYSGSYDLAIDPSIDLLSCGWPEGNTASETHSPGMEIVHVQDGLDVLALDQSVDDLELMDPVHRRLHEHCLVNSIADYYEIDSLAELSTKKTKEILESNWSTDAFSQLLDHATGSTSDEHFRRMLGTNAANHVNELRTCDVFAEGGIAQDLAAYILPSLVEKLDAAEKQATRPNYLCGHCNREFCRDLEEGSIQRLTKYCFHCGQKGGLFAI